MPEPLADLRVFLDTNVLISASLSSASKFLRFWRMTAVELITSSYSIEEACRHLTGSSLGRFEKPLLDMDEVKLGDEMILPVDVELVAKDRPILAAALAGHADYLLTGDKKHFGHLYGVTIAGTTVLPPMFLLNQEMHRIDL